MFVLDVYNQKRYEPLHERTNNAYAKTKAQISFAVTPKVISAFVFATRIVQSHYFLNTKSHASSHLLSQLSVVCDGTGGKPKLLVLSRKGSYAI